MELWTSGCISTGRQVAGTGHASCWRIRQSLDVGLWTPRRLAPGPGSSLPLRSFLKGLTAEVCWHTHSSWGKKPYIGGGSGQWFSVCYRNCKGGLAERDLSVWKKKKVWCYKALDFLALSHCYQLHMGFLGPVTWGLEPIQHLPPSQVGEAWCFLASQNPTPVSLVPKHFSREDHPSLFSVSVIWRPCSFDSLTLKCTSLWLIFKNNSDLRLSIHYVARLVYEFYLHLFESSWQAVRLPLLFILYKWVNKGLNYRPRVTKLVSSEVVFNLSSPSITLAPEY